MPSICRPAGWTSYPFRGLMRFLIDAQLPTALARWIDAQDGHNALHVRDIGLSRATDEQIWEVALRDHNVIISKDEDFVMLRSVRSVRSVGPQIVWVRIPNCRKNALLLGFSCLWPQLLENLRQGERIIELRG